MHEALGPQLPHRGVDHGYPVRPSVQARNAPSSSVPVVAAGAVVGPGGLGSGREHLRVEVAPAQLTDVRIGPETAAQLLFDLGRADAAESQRGAHTRGRVSGEVVVARRHTRRDGTYPRVQRPAGRRLAARHGCAVTARPGRRRVRASEGSDLIHAIGGGDGLGGAVDRTPRRGEPTAVVRREHLEMVAGCGLYGAWLDHGHTGMGLHRHAGVGRARASARSRRQQTR